MWCVEMAGRAAGDGMGWWEPPLVVSSRSPKEAAPLLCVTSQLLALGSEGGIHRTAG